MPFRKTYHFNSTRTTVIAALLAIAMLSLSAWIVDAGLIGKTPGLAILIIMYAVTFFFVTWSATRSLNIIEDAARSSGETLRQILNSSAEDFYVIDRDYNVVLISANAEKNLKGAWGKPVTIGVNILDLLPAGKKEYLKENYDKALSGRGLEYETPGILNGKRSWVLVRYIPVSDGKNNITGVNVITKDITERKKAEEELNQSNERFGMISRTTNDAVWEWDLETGALWSNETHQHMYGLTVADPVPVEAMWRQRIHPGDRELIVNRQKEALESDKNVFISEYRFLTGKNEYRDIYDRCYIVKNEEGKPVKMVGSMMDITERKKAEIAVKESEERYRSLIERASDAIMITDQKGNFIDVNSSMCSLFGYTKEELLQLNISSVIDPEQLKIDPIQFDVLLTGKSLLRQRRMMHKDGTIIEVEANIKMLPDGRLMAIARDITERIQTEQLIRNSEETRRLIMNSALDAIIGMDTKGAITVWTPRAEKIFGWKEKEIIGKTIADTIIPGEYREEHKKGLAHYLKTGEGPLLNKIIEVSALNKTGKRFPIELSIIPIKQGVTEFFCAFIRDITERKQAAEIIKQNEGKYSTLVEQAVDAIALYDTNGKILDVNTGAVLLLGYTKEELKTMSLEQVLTKDEMTINPVRYDILQKGGSTVKQRAMSRKDGSVVQTEVRSQQLPDGRFLSVIRDLTERLKAQDLILREKQLSNEIIDSIPGVFYLRDKNKFLRWNKQFEIITGYSHEEISKLDPVTDFYDNNERKKVYEAVNRVFTEGSAILEATPRTKNGGKIPFYFNARLINYEGKQCMVVTGIDISDRKKAEQELEQSYNEIRLLTEHQQNIREEERTQIAREIHDELGQQLTVLKMDISWLSKKVGGNDDIIQQKMTGLKEMLDSTVKTVRKIASELRPSLLDDLGLVAAMEWQLKEFENRSGIKTKFAETEAEELSIPRAVKTGLYRIFQESLTNVARHAEAKKVILSLQQKNDMIVMKIEDDGVGFDTKKATTTKTLGILGMKERALMMGGTYIIKSKPGKGTIVEVSVPVNQL